MRERKYRAFVKQCNKMIYSENSYPKGNSDYRFVASEDHKKGLGVEYFTSRTEYVNQYGGVVLLPDWRVFTDEEAPVTEYTGLKDKNGREIWEGDIRKDGWGRKFKVVYDNDLAAFYGEYINGPSESLADCGPDSEYLGTVFENPDLLEAASANKEEL
ncbi:MULTISPECIES: YopX family protein [Bacillus]|nr:MULTISPECIES: YopX family protein [Bacillus]CAI6292563.1 YopX domain-containing protein [Bacillus subtilis]